MLIYQIEPCKARISLLQDAIAQQTLDAAQKAEVQAARQDVQDSASATVGSLPNLLLGSSGRAGLQAHPRYISLPTHDSATSQEVSDALLPSIPQRTPLWYRARQGAVTASTAALFLGLLEPKTSKQLASSGLSLYAIDGHARLQRALAEARSSEHTAAPDRGPFAACAMAMGTIKEDDVMLTYLEHMDTKTECAANPSQRSAFPSKAFGRRHHDSEHAVVAQACHQKGA